MVTNFAEKSPQKRGIIAANEEINQYPDDSTEQQELLEIRNAGLDAVEAIQANPNNNQIPVQGRINSSRSKRSKLSPEEQADQVAQKMLKAGKNPQEIGAATAKILGFKS
jgi:hypothetical protein